MNIEILYFFFSKRKEKIIEIKIEEAVPIIDKVCESEKAEFFPSFVFG